MKKNKVLITLTSSVMLASGVLAMNAATSNNNVQTVQAAKRVSLYRRGTAYRLTKKAYIYNNRGRRVNRTLHDVNTIVYAKTTKKIHGKTYYKIGANAYVDVRNTGYITGSGKTLKKRAYIYNGRGKRVSRKLLATGTRVHVKGTRRMNHQRYYRIGSDSYVDVRNMTASRKPASHKTLNVGVGATFNSASSFDHYRLTKKAYAYDSKGNKRTSKLLPVGRDLYVKGTKRVGNRTLLQIGLDTYVDVRNAQAVSSSSSTNSGSTSTNTSKKPSTNKPSTTKPSTNKPSSNTGSSNANKPAKGNDNKGTSVNHGSEEPASHPDYTIPARGERNYLTNNVAHVKQLVIEKINEMRRGKKSWAIDEYLQDYKTNPEIQAMADLRADETAKAIDAGHSIGHSRPDGTPMSGAEFQKMLPGINADYEGASSFGEDLGGVYAMATDEKTADAIIAQFMSDKEHKDILLGEDTPYAYAAVGLHFDPMKGFHTSFEMIGDTFAPYHNNPWK